MKLDNDGLGFNGLGQQNGACMAGAALPFSARSPQLTPRIGTRISVAKRDGC